MYIEVFYSIIFCQKFILRAPYISLSVMKDIIKRKYLNMYITLENVIININTDFEAISRSKYPLGNYIYSNKRMDSEDLVPFCQKIIGYNAL